MSSMTGFAQTSGEGTEIRVTWEIRTVNHRYLDITLRLPEALREIEMAAREIVQQYCSRGKIECFCRIDPLNGVQSSLKLNEKLIQELTRCCVQIQRDLPAGVAHIDPMRLLLYPGIVLSNNIDYKLQQEFILSVLHRALQALSEMRQREGIKLKAHIRQRAEQLVAYAARITLLAPAVVEEQRDKMRSRFAELRLELDQQRLEQEMVFLAQKIDISEELDRIMAHVQEIIRIMDQENRIGRRLDFLMQELHREVNTVGAKSSHRGVVQSVIDMKVLIEQMREQVQNIE